MYIHATYYYECVCLSLSLSRSLSLSIYIYTHICKHIYIYRERERDPSGCTSRWASTSRVPKGGWYGWKPSSSSNFSIRAFQVFSLIELRQTVPCRAVRADSISINRIIPPSYRWDFCFVPLPVSMSPSPKGGSEKGDPTQTSLKSHFETTFRARTKVVLVKVVS